MLGSAGDTGYLAQIAQRGGSVFQAPLLISDTNPLPTVLGNIGNSALRSCTYALETGVDPHNLVVLINDNEIPRDDSCADGSGWTMLDSDRSANMIRLCPESCFLLKTGDTANIKAFESCS
jgi:hypothetical protein